MLSCKHVHVLSFGSPQSQSDSKKEDKILEYAIQDAKDGSYPHELTKEKERSVLPS